MSLAWTPLAVPLVLGAVVAVVVAAWLATRRGEYARVPGLDVAILLLVAAGVWLVTYGLELASTTQAEMLLWNKLSYFGIGAIPPLWLGYVLAYAEQDAPSRRRWALLFLVPAVTTLLALTNEAHWLLWDSVAVADVGTYSTIDNGHGPAWYGFMLYSYALILTAFAVLVRHYRRVEGIYRRQVSGLLVGAAAPSVGGVAYATGVNPLAPLNPAVLGFLVTVGAVTWSVVRHELFVLAPIARETAIEQMREAVLVLDSRGCVVDANPAANAILADDERPIGRDHEALLGVDAATADDEPLLTIEVDGTTRRFECGRTPLSGDGGERIGTLLMLQDVTERERRERDLRRQNERLEEFASVVSHDLRNPLGVARGYLELAREDPDPEHFDRAEGALDQMERIVEDLLTLAREGKVVEDPEPVALAAVAREAWETVATGDAELVVDSAATVAADRDRLRRALANLVRNSVEHGRPDGDGGSGADGEPTAAPLTVRIEDTPEGFAVADDGVGIPAETREAAFEPGVTTNDDGTGLGLAIVENIAEAHGWSVRAEESAAGGARFAVET